MSIFDHYAAYYDLLYRDKDYEAEADFVVERLRRHGGEMDEVLDLGCGTGLHALALGRRGIRVTGVDASPKMVERARKRAAGCARADNQSLAFEVGDARTVRLERSFDAVVSLFHVVSYQTTNESLAEIFATAASHLDTGGVFLFDFWYGPAVLSEGPSTRVKRLENDEIEVVRLAEPTMDVNADTVDVGYTLWITEKRTGEVERLTESHLMRYLFLPEVELMLTESGFRLAETCAWMTGAALDAGCWSATAVAIRE